MSKSVNESATLYLSDDDDTIRKKIMKAKTDSGPTEKNSAMPDYIENIFMLMKLVSSGDSLVKYTDQFKNAAIRYGDLKKELAEDMVRFIAPIRHKTNELLADEIKLQKILEKGAEKARKSAEATMALVRNSMGLNY